jgi:pre-rRNA-processing protein TSR4
MAKSNKGSKDDKERPVELGFVEEKESWKLSSAYFVSKVGGKPSWLDLKNIPKQSDLKCPNCDGK